MKLLWLDCETTGLSPQKHRLLEVAAFVTSIDAPWTIESPIIECVLPVSGSEVVCFDPLIIDMHTKNGLLAECAKRNVSMILENDPPTKGLSLPEVARYNHALGMLEDALLPLIPNREELEASLGKEEARKQSTLLAGFGTHFDLGFIRVHMPNLAKNLHYSVFDITAVKFFCRSLGMPSLPHGEAHRALPDTMASLQNARSCAEWLEGMGDTLRVRRA